MLRRLKHQANYEDIRRQYVQYAVDVAEGRILDRGWYAGAIGMYDENGDGKFYVPIRSGIIKNKNLLLFTGSGIVSKSNPEKEWDETTLKLEHILSYFN